jgi:hypothetical protein
MEENLLFKDNDNWWEVGGLQDLSQGANSFLPSNTSVSFTLFDTAGTTVSGQTFPTDATYNTVKGRGTWNGTLEDGLALSLYTHYDLVIDISGSGIPTGKICIRHFCVERGKLGNSP